MVSKSYFTFKNAIYLTPIPHPHAPSVPHSIPYRDPVRTQPGLSAITDIPVNPHNVQEINPVLSAAHIAALILQRGQQNTSPSPALPPPRPPSAPSRASILLMLIVLTDEDQHCFHPFAA